MTETDKIMKRDELIYTSCYCEENIYMMCKMIAKQNQGNLDHCTVVYISNPYKTIPIWRQKNGSSQPGTPTVWDYHVILYYHDYDKKEFYIYDFDTELSFPCNAKEYVMEAFHPELQLKEQFQRYFRMVPGSVYLKEFASDRSHMLKEDGEYMKPPPKYPAITSNNETMNLLNYMDMTENITSPKKYGVVIDEEQFFTIVISNVQINVANT